MTPFAGFDMPVQYDGILKEHSAVRHCAGLFDVSHMGEALVHGAGAALFLDYLLPNRVDTLAVGKALYSPMCHPDGGVVDDVIVYRLAETHFLVVLNAANTSKDLAWMRSHSGSFDVEIEDVSDAWALLALQGPLALDILATAFPAVDARGLPRFGFCQSSLKVNGEGIECMVSRTGYTGEDGVELYCAPQSAEALAHALLCAGRPNGMVLAGLGARDSLRLEAGLPLYGHEIDDNITPLEAGLGWTVKLTKPADFMGKAALAEQKAKGVPRRLLHFILEDRRIARAGTEVYCAGQAVGQVVSGSQSPVLGKPIGSALVNAGADLSGLAVEIRGSRIPLRVEKPPLHKSMHTG